VKRRSWIVALGVAAVTIAGLALVPLTIASAATTTTSIQDTNQGTGVGQVQFSSGWNGCSGNCAKATDNSFEWTSVPGSTVTIKFTGHQITLYGIKEPWSYISTVAVDGGSTVDVDEYAATATASVSVYTSPTLAEGTHTLVFAMTSRKSTASTGGESVTFDRADVVSGSTSTASPTPSPTASTTSTHASGLPWSDGGYFDLDPSQATAFANWRGRPVDNILAFTTRNTWATQLNNWWAGTVPSTFSATRDDFILGVPLWTDDGDAGTDAQWKQLATEFAAVDPDGYIRLGWEMNCCFSLATNAATWTAQYTRAATLIRSAAPKVRIVFNPNEGTSSNGTVADASTLFVNGLVDVIAIDAYDWYPAYNSDANATSHFSKQYGWDWWYAFAQSKGLPFALGEFSVYTGSAASGGDNPAYFTYVYNWLSAKNAAKPGSIAFVSLFNETASYCGCDVYPTTLNPNSAARYKSIINSLSTN
jgi:hypothetical protein